MIVIIVIVSYDTNDYRQGCQGLSRSQDLFYR